MAISSAKSLKFHKVELLLLLMGGLSAAFFHAGFRNGLWRKERLINIVKSVVESKVKSYCTRIEEVNIPFNSCSLVVRLSFIKTEEYLNALSAVAFA